MKIMNLSEDQEKNMKKNQMIYKSLMTNYSMKLS